MMLLILLLLLLINNVIAFVAVVSSSLRLWDVNQPKKHLHVIKGRDKQGTLDCACPGGSYHMRAL